MISVLNVGRDTRVPVRIQAYPPHTANMYPGEDNIQVIGMYEPTIQPIIQQSFASKEVEAVFTAFRKEILEMCCNCNNEQKKVYFDTLPETLELSPEFLKKKCRDLTALDLQVLTRWRMARTDNTHKDAASFVMSRVVQYQDHTVQECKSVL